MSEIEILTAYRRECEHLQRIAAELRQALREALVHVEAVDQNSELAIIRWRQLAEEPKP